MNWDSLKNTASSIGKIACAVGRKSLDAAVAELSNIPLSVTDTIELGYRQTLTEWHGYKADRLVKQGKYNEAMDHLTKGFEEIEKSGDVLNRMHEASTDWDHPYGDLYSAVKDAADVYKDVVLKESMGYMPVESLSASGGYSLQQMAQLREAFGNSGYTEQQFTYMVSRGFAPEILFQDPPGDNDLPGGPPSGGSAEGMTADSEGCATGNSPLADQILEGGGNTYSPEQRAIFETRSQEEGQSSDHLARVYEMGIEKSYLNSPMNSKIKIETSQTNATSSERGARSMPNGAGGGSISVEALRAANAELGKYLENLGKIKKEISERIEDCRDTTRDNTITVETANKVQGELSKLSSVNESVNELRSKINEVINILEDTHLRNGGN